VGRAGFLLLLIVACSSDSEPCEDCDDTADSAVDDTGDTSDTGDTGDTGEVEPFEPELILFIGNSFTFGGPVPDIVDLLANDAGWRDPDIEMSAFGGETLEGHRGRTETVDKVDAGDWDVLVLQEYSTRPTDNVGDPAQFKTDATWFHDRVLQNSPDVQVVLYETWARHPDHWIYPGSFANPAEMQAQLRTHYNDAADTWIPANATTSPIAPLQVALVGDTWEQHLAEPDPLRLHASDDYHAGLAGQYLNALVIYSTIYGRSTAQRTPWKLPPGDAARLQATADATTGQLVPGGPDGTALPAGLTTGQRVLLDLGSSSDTTDSAGWNDLTGPTGGIAGNLEDDQGATSTVDISVTDGFGGVNTSGLETALYPASATQDSFFCGSFDDHADGLDHPGEVTLHGLDPTATYQLLLFASRSGNDGGRGRLTRYTADGQWADLEVSDNTIAQAALSGIHPAPDGTLAVEVAVSPAGTGRFCYLGVLELIRE
jgi:hypothetical protein